MATTRSSRRRPWPNDAREARDRSAEEACSIIRQLTPLIDKPFSEFTVDEILRRISRANQAANTIARHLEQQGAPTRPE